MGYPMIPNKTIQHMDSRDRDLMSSKFTIRATPPTITTPLSTVSRGCRGGWHLLSAHPNQDISSWRTRTLLKKQRRQLPPMDPPNLPVVTLLTARYTNQSLSGLNLSHPVGHPFANHNCGGVGVGPRHLRHHRRIGNPQSLETLYTTLLIHHGHWV